jgi:hypothetical protein
MKAQIISVGRINVIKPHKRPIKITSLMLKDESGTYRAKSNHQRGIQKSML